MGTNKSAIGKVNTLADGSNAAGLPAFPSAEEIRLAAINSIMPGVNIRSFFQGGGREFYAEDIKRFEAGVNWLKNYILKKAISK